MFENLKLVYAASSNKDLYIYVCNLPIILYIAMMKGETKTIHKTRLSLNVVLAILYFEFMEDYYED